MDQLCIRCARRSFNRWSANTARAHVSSRSLFSSARVLDDKKSGDAGVAQSGTSLDAAIGSSNDQVSQPQRPLIRRVSEPEQTSVPRRTSSAPLGRASSAAEQSGQARAQTSRPILKRPSPQPGQVLRRTSLPGAGQVLNRTRGPGAAGKTPAPRPAGSVLRRQSPGQGQSQGQSRYSRQQGVASKGQKGPDKRRRRTLKNEEEEYDEKDLEQQMDDYIAKHVDRPANPTEPLPYNPAKITLEELKSDWPNTPLSASGMTESVVQKIEWLSRRLPHGYQSPEQIAEHFLKGNLTRFESEEEKQTVLKLASELSKKTKTEAEDGTLHKHESPRFRMVEDTTFTSLASKSGDKEHLVGASVKGDYGRIQQQKYAFMQSAENMLNNNESYGSVQAHKLLRRVQSLIPQARAGAPQPTKKINP